MTEIKINGEVMAIGYGIASIKHAVRYLTNRYGNEIEVEFFQRGVNVTEKLKELL